jgi:hypothetical protein
MAISKLQDQTGQHIDNGWHTITGWASDAEESFEKAIRNRNSAFNPLSR